MIILNNTNHKIDINKAFMYNYVDFIVDFIQNTGEMLTGMACLEWSCGFRRAHL